LFLPKKDNLYQSRERLFRILSRYNFTGSSRNKLTVVFDGKEGVIDFDSPFAFEVVFSREEEADDLIERMVKKSKNPRGIVVVTDDRGLTRRITRYGARVKAVKEFFASLFAPPSYHKLKDKFDLTSRQIDSINEELRKLWLGEDDRV